MQLLSQRTNNALLTVAILFSISIVTSKAGMNLFGALLAITTLLLLAVKWKSLPDKIRLIFLIGLGSFGFFSAMTFFVTPSASDFNSFLQKNTYLLAIPALSVIFVNRDNRKKVFTAIAFACLVAAIFSVYKFAAGGNLDFYYNRQTGFIDFSRHLNALLLGISITACALLSNQSRNIKAVLLVCLVVLLSSIFVSGTRGAWLASAVALGYLLIRYHRKYLPYIALIIVVAGLSSYAVYPENTQLFAERVASIANTKEQSNSERLTMWKAGFAYLKHQVLEHPENAAFGSGMNSTAKQYSDYIFSLPGGEREQFLLNGNLHGGTDFHNGFLDVSIKSGILYGLLLFLGLLSALIVSFLTPKAEDPTYQIASCYLVGLFCMLPFYSMLQDYSAYTIALAVSVVLGKTLEEHSYES